MISHFILPDLSEESLVIDTKMSHMRESHASFNQVF